MENTAPSHRPQRIVWFALATFGALLLLPATRYLVRTQLQMQTLTHATQSNPEREQAIGLLHLEDYPLQLALATRLPALQPDEPAYALAHSRARNRQIAGLVERFPNNPSVYANFLRYMTLGEMRLMRDRDIEPDFDRLAATRRGSVYEPSDETQRRFEAAAAKGAELDSDNAYFPMMQALTLFNTHRDAEGLEALKTAGRCAHWTEYYQDDAAGQQRLQDLTYGRQGALANLNIACDVLFPQYSQFRKMARLATHLAIQKECIGDIDEAIAIRHAVMRCGGLMRSQGTSYITALVGIAISNIAISDVSAEFDFSQRAGLIDGQVYIWTAHNRRKALSPDLQGLVYGSSIRAETQDHQQVRRRLYDKYLNYTGHSQEAEWAKAEIAAGEEAKAIGTAGMQASLLDARDLGKHRMAWLANWALLSGALLLLALGVAARIAEVVRPRKGLLALRLLYALLVIGSLGCWQWYAADAGMRPTTQIANLFAGLSGTGDVGNWQERNALELQSLAFGLSLVAPILFVGLLAGLSRFQRVPVATGLGRGLRGAALPVAAALFLAYGASLIPTVCAEAALETHRTAVMRNEPHCMAESVQKTWPGDPRP